MNLIETAVRWRHGTFVLFCLLALLGVLALFNLPIELQPGGDTPEISIRTNYPGASPTEVEDLITRPIEEALEAVQGIQEIASSSRAGSSDITAEFAWGTDINQRFVDVLSKLQLLSSLPEEAADPSVEIISGDSRPMMWAVLFPKPGYQADADHYRDLVDDLIVPKLRQIEGIGEIITPGGREKEVEILVNPQALGDRQLNLEDVVTALRNNNRDIRGGPMAIGRREYRVRTVSRSQDISELAGFVLRRDSTGTVYLGDVATVQMGRKIQNTTLLIDGEPTAGIGIERKIGANVPKISQGVRRVLQELEEELNARGEGVEFVINYDENDYIQQSIGMVQSNLIIGSILAAITLLLFLGSIRSVAVVALTIPTTVITVFIVLMLLGRSLNVISLAGIAFSVGMVVDNAIVVLENIYTHMQRGKSPVQAAIDGTQEVWSAMLASTLTTAIVFIPIILIEGEAGRLFADIGIALATAVLFSLFAALTLVPMLSGLFLHEEEAQQMYGQASSNQGNWLERSVSKSANLFRKIETKAENFLLLTVSWSLGPRYVGRRLFLLTIPLLLLWAGVNLLPPADYLPEGNRNLITWLAEPFPGTSIDESLRLTQPMSAFVQKQPEVQRHLVLVSSGRRLVLVFLKPELATANNLNSMVNRLLAVSGDFPGFRFVFPTRASIFSNPGKSYEVNVVGSDLGELDAIAQNLNTQIGQLQGVQNVRSNFVEGAPELQIIPNRGRLAEVGLSEADLGQLIEAALGGIKASEFVEGRRELDVTVELKDNFVQTPEDLNQLVLYTSNGQQVQLQDVAEVLDTTGPDAINRIDLERAVTLTINVAREAPLGKLVQQTEADILKPMRQSLPPGYRLELSGSADVLNTTLSQLNSAFLLSLFITYLLLVALYRSFLYPVVIMITIPMGLTGALLGIVIVNWIPGMTVPFDLITRLGFVILTGIVVNNAILLIDRALQLQQEGKSFDDSLYYATRDRLRPIFMTVGTTILGMLPLAFIPGQGTELYQGLGIALIGGLALATFLTPTVVPALMGLLRDFTPKLKRSL
ncbi:efflux RND transporter permease subunit [Gloeocapsa sp. PCC 73106]|uniref:efflux RND transporter permease subunit n=1 Tax=Gloeocapsa sp. PCC 73106 TaxID=102232 RepID=UPI0002AD0745|nr:efflux RND transporter permease subunit [Gloeocapsa sp. PCC 73106]ELR98845.1 cation/multidrug efflux pump [Gloeocapsa sp. PCC 73106]